MPAAAVPPSSSPTSSPAAPTTPGTAASTSAFPQPLSFQLSPTTARKKGPPALSLRPPSPAAAGSSAAPGFSFAGSSDARPHSARPAHLLDLPGLSPSTPTAISSSAPSPTRRGHARTRSDISMQQTSSTRLMYASAVPSRRDDSPPPPRIPKPFVRRKLVELAPHFYQKSSTADCTVLLRLPNQPTPAVSPLTPPESASLNQQRRSSAPNTNEITVLTYKLHREYLCAQSALFRRYFTSALSPAMLPETPSTWTARPRARLVPAMSTDTHPCLLIDLPDTTSFDLLLHFMYWGDFSVVEQALTTKQVKWGVLFQMVEILGMENDIKISCSRYWRRYIKPHNGPSIAALAAAAATSESPPSSASSGGSTVTSAPPRTSGWPKGPASSPPARSAPSATSTPAGAPLFPTSVSDDEDDDVVLPAGGRMDDDAEDFESFQARVGRARSDEIEVQLASGLGVLGHDPPLRST